MNRNLQRFFFLNSLYFTSHVSLDSKKSVQTFEKGHIFFLPHSSPMFHSLFCCCCCLRCFTSNNNCPNHAMHNPIEKSCHLCLESWESSQISWWQQQQQQQKRLTTDTSSGISLKGSPERSLTYGGTTSVKILCCVRKQKKSKSSMYQISS